MPETRDRILGQLENARKDLLDLTLRNPLLNYRPLKARGLELVNDNPGDTFRLLVREKQSFSFLVSPAAESADEGGDSAPPSRTHDVSVDKLCLQTPYDQKELDKRLLGTHHAARTYIEEQGINVLYLSLGILAWTETDTESTKVLKAPLILIPVALARRSAQEGFRLQYNEDEMTENPSLYKKLETELGIRLPGFPDHMDEWDPETYLADVGQAISVKPQWRVDMGAHCLGFFSFGKFMMYKDLDVDTWPEDKDPASHPLLQRLLGDGFQEAPASIGDDEHIDEHLLPTDIHTVKDADSSQVLAITDVKKGRNLVVQGPPGTGKSQTITNMIAELLQDGKRVLFVAEKMAALQVVKSRLDQVGLGSACLELHSHKANKKMVLDDLRATWAMARPEPPSFATDLAMLKEFRDRLNMHSKLLHEPVGETGVNPFQALGHLVKLRDQLPEDAPRVRLDGAWTAGEHARKNALVEDVQSLLRETGCPVTHPFWGARLTVIMPSDQDDIHQALLKCRAALTRLTEYLSGLGAMYGLPECPDQEDAKRALGVVQTLVASPVPDGSGILVSVWTERHEELRILLGAFEPLAALHSQFDSKIRENAWREPMSGDLNALRRHGRRLFRAFSGEYRGARRHVAAMQGESVKLSNDEAIAVLEAVEQAQGYDTVWRAYGGLARVVFGENWRESSSDWRLLADWTAFGRALADDVASGQKPVFAARIAEASGGKTAWRELASALAQRLDDWEQALQDLRKKLNWDDRQRFSDGTTLGALTFAQLAEWLGNWERWISTLPLLARVNQMGVRLQQEGLLELLPVMERWEPSRNHLAHLFAHAWFQAVVERGYRERPQLRDFVGSEHGHVVSRFQQLDHRHLSVNQQQIALQHWKGLPPSGTQGQVGVLQHEFQKMKRHMPIRKLLRESGRAVQAIKPVFMMSPMSVATYLAPDSVEFDVVIFDEASQVRPVDAYGSILRGRQIVVVGDRQQLPPTSFFDQLAADDEGEAEHVAADVESILTLLSGRGVPERMLRWHYRSRHESLIAVSNAEFYNNQLVVFPSPVIAGEQTGLVYRYLPDTAYDRGGSRTNRKEAAHVARAVLHHARENPGQTLGVVAFSVAQMDAIQAELEMLRRKSPGTEQFFAVGGSDPFFVKNLENVQGDERDVIFISVGYGKDESGHLTMSFGPLNSNGGERRLNVMISRARLRCEVFTNLLPDDIDLGKTPARGVQAFKSFLQYAKSGKMAIPVPSGRDADSPFEEAVRDALVRQGYRVEPQVGSGGFRIDMAVVDPGQPGRYLLGIECDGATYHRARSARDRDRLRQQILEGLGWTLCRIWSTDWFRDPERELRRVIEAIEMERTRLGGLMDTGETAGSAGDPMLRGEGVYDQGPEETAVVSSPGLEEQMQSVGDTVLDPSLREPDASSPVPYRTADLQISLWGEELHAVPRARLAAWMLDVVRVESPVHVEEVYRRVANAAGVRRIGARIRSAMELAVRVAAKGEIVRRGDFLWIAGMMEPPVRDRSQEADVSRKLEHIAPEEICAAITRVLLHTRGLEPDQIPGAVARSFGIHRLAEDSRAIIESVFHNMMTDRHVTISGRYAVAAE